MKLLEITPIDDDSPENDAFVQRMQRLRYSKMKRDRRKGGENKDGSGAGGWHVRFTDRLAVYELVEERQTISPASSDSDIVLALSDAIRAAKHKLGWSEDVIEASEEHLAKNQKAWIEEYRDHITKLSAKQSQGFTTS